eukprot:3403706-Pyramimonas_sp.AAC.1
MHGSHVMSGEECQTTAGVAVGENGAPSRNACALDKLILAEVEAGARVHPSPHPQPPPWPGGEFVRVEGEHAAYEVEQIGRHRCR